MHVVPVGNFPRLLSLLCAADQAAKVSGGLHSVGLDARNGDSSARLLPALFGHLPLVSGIYRPEHVIAAVSRALSLPLYASANFAQGI